MWWTQHKDTYSRMTYGGLTTWDDMKAAMNKRFKPNDYRLRAHIQLTQLKQGNMSLEEYTNQF